MEILIKHDILIRVCISFEFIENTNKKNSDRHSNCMDSSSPRYKPHPPVEPRKSGQPSRRRPHSAGDVNGDVSHRSKDDKRTYYRLMFLLLSSSGCRLDSRSM